jgi:hypothetical protein
MIGPRRIVAAAMRPTTMAHPLAPIKAGLKEFDEAA